MKTHPSSKNDTQQATKGNARLLAVCGILVFITLAVYWQATGFGFVNYDDPEYVTDNPMVMRGLTWDGLKWAFTTTDQANWHPLTYLSLMADVSLSNANPRFMHATNIILHICSVLVLFLVLHSLTSKVYRSAFAAGLFAVHPLHVESVVWVVERKDCLSTLFWMLTIAAYVRYTKRPSRLRYASALVLFALGLMAKPMLVTLPIVLLLLDYWPLNRTRTLLLREKLPMFFLSAASSAVTIWAQSAGGAVSSFELLPLGVRLANATVAYVAYIGKMLWPQNLSPFYPHPGPTLPQWQVIGSAVLLVSTTILAVVLRKRCPCVFVGWLWYLVTLLPVIGIIQVGAQAMADRYTYVPLIGLYILVAWLLPGFSRKPAPKYRLILQSAPVIAVFVLIVLAVVAHVQVGYWRDDEALWRRALSANPDSPHIHRLLGGALRKTNKPEAAIVHFRKALELEPGFADAQVSLGACLGDLGKLAEAELEFRQALRIEPWNESALHNLAILLSRQNRHSEAIVYFRRVLSRRPKRVSDLIGLANSLLELRKPDRAIPLLKRALDIDPTAWDAANNLAWAYATYPDASIRDPQSAVRLAESALTLRKADKAMVLDTLAAAYAALGDYHKAVEASKESIELNRRKGGSDLIRDSMTRLKLYQAGEAYVEAP